jgi:hypothetical protein
MTSDSETGIARQRDRGVLVSLNIDDPRFDELRADGGLPARVPAG